MSTNASSALVYQYYLKQIQNLYLQRNLTNIQSVETLLKQFPGKEYLVYIQICKKYGVEPEKQRSAEDIAAQMIVSPKHDGKVSKWLIDKGYSSYANMQNFRTMKWDVFKSISTEEQLKAQGVQSTDLRILLELIYLETGVKEEVKSTAETLDGPPVRKPTAPEPDFAIGDDCYTKVFKAGEKEVEEGWLKARVMRVNDDNTYDIHVHNAMAHGVAAEAVNVPRKFLKQSVTDAELMPPAPVKKHIDPKKFSRGDRVWVCGLRSHQSYNGLGGTIVVFHEKRYQVELDNGELFAIRPENLFSWDVDVPREAVEEGMSRLGSAGFTKEEDEVLLRDLITRLMRYDTSRSTDHLKLGQFAAGYMIAQRRFLSKGKQ